MLSILKFDEHHTQVIKLSIVRLWTDATYYLICLFAEFSD